MVVMLIDRLSIKLLFINPLYTLWFQSLLKQKPLGQGPLFWCFGTL